MNRALATRPQAECDLDGKRLYTVSFRCSPEVRDALLNEAEKYGTTSSDLICTIVQRHIRSQSLLRTHEHPGDALVNEMVEFFRAARKDDLLDDIELQGLIRRAVKLANHFCDLVERKSTAGEAA